MLEEDLKLSFEKQIRLTKIIFSGLLDYSTNVFKRPVFVLLMPIINVILEPSISSGEKCFIVG